MCQSCDHQEFLSGDDSSRTLYPALLQQSIADWTYSCLFVVREKRTRGRQEDKKDFHY